MQHVKLGLIFFVSHLFIIATGTAALIHSTWSLATAFTGTEPPQGTMAWWWWVTPAFLLAISIDVGQIATSAQIANGQRTPAKYATFAVLAIATYYLQWLYLAVHLPLIPLGAGVNSAVAPFASGVRDMALWLLPGLLPLSTLLYTFSYASVRKQRNANVKPQTELRIERPQIVQLPQPNVQQIASGAKRYVITCPLCDETINKDNRRSASSAWSAHMRHHHEGIKAPAIEMVESVV